MTSGGVIMLAGGARSHRCWQQAARVGAAALLAAGWAVLAGSPSLAASLRDGHPAAVHVGARSHQPQPPIVADDGFRPQPDGFGFPNYTNTLPGGETVTNLTAADMRLLFGDTVCAYHSGDQCYLTPEAAAWMNEVNLMMDGGHCFGMSAYSLLLRSPTLSLWPSAYGANQTVGLPIARNRALQRRIAYAWAFQLIPAVYTKVITGTPDQVLNQLIRLLPGTHQETPTVSFWHRDFSGGHAVTPYAVKDLGGGKYEILVYDNNFPKTTREITVNTRANTWSYYAATQPGVPLAQYNGDARSGTLRLYPATPGLSVQPSLFGSRLRAATASSTGALPSAGQFPVQIMLTGSDHTDLPRLLLTDDAGNHTGYLNGRQVNTIPGGGVHYLVFGDWQNGPEPVYTVPAGTHVTLTVDGTTLRRTERAHVAVIGNGFDVTLDGIQVRPGDPLAIDPAADGSGVRFATPAAQSATMSLGASYPDSHYTFTIHARIPAGAELTARRPLNTGQFSLGQQGGQAPGQYAVTVEREDSGGVHYGQTPVITLQPGYGTSLNYQARDQDEV
jgi:hypothetical protein